jgi:integrase
VLGEELAASMSGKGRDDLVFTDQRGGVLRNSNWRARVFRPAVKRCQPVDDTFPTLPVSARANVKAVQRMLGHAKASMTLDTYADLFDDDLDEVADRLDAAIQATADALRTAKVP